MRTLCNRWCGAKVAVHASGRVTRVALTQKPIISTALRWSFNFAFMFKTLQSRDTTTREVCRSLAMVWCVVFKVKSPCTFTLSVR